MLLGVLLITGCAGGDTTEKKVGADNVKVDGNTKINANVGDANVEVNGNVATVNYNNKTVKAENLSITTTGDGAYEVNLSVKNNLSLPPQMPIEQWCVEGKTYDMKNEKGQSTSATILGIEDYKQKTYCKASSTTKVYDMEIKTTYYFDYGAKDVWAVVNLGGTVNEVHINNN